MQSCVYLTIYYGNKMPMFYIGSSTVESVKFKGYHGSVRSKIYKHIWKLELNKNPHLFKTVILSTHSSRKEATKREEFIQRKLNVIKNPLYINKSYACKNGVFGKVMSGDSHIFYKKKGKDVPWYGLKRSEQSKKNYSESKKGSKNPSACEYKIYDNNDTLIISFKGNFKENMSHICKDMTTINAFIKSYKTNKKLEYKRNGKTGPFPTWNKEFEGWHAERIAPRHRKKLEEDLIGRNHYFNPNTGESVVSKHHPEGFLLGRPDSVKRKISKSKSSQ